MDSLDVEMNKIEDINLRASAEYFSGSDMNRKSFSTRKTVVLE